eukprot:Skav217091  [mRNA]  locus=scaffold187:18119:25644:+ [translate_table: standard]
MFATRITSAPLEPSGDYYFHNVLMNIFLVNMMALSAFAVPLPDVGDRLSLLSTTLVAVTAYQTVINENIPQLDGPSQPQPCAEFTFCDWLIGGCFVAGWVLLHLAMIFLSPERLAGSSWKGKKPEKMLWCPKCNENRPSRIKQHYFTPGCKVQVPEYAMGC